VQRLLRGRRKVNLTREKKIEKRKEEKEREKEEEEREREREREREIGGGREERINISEEDTSSGPR